MLEFLENNIYFVYFIICFSILILIMSIVNSIYYNSLMVDNNGTKITKSAATGLFSFSIICAFFSLVVLIWASYILTLTYSAQDKLNITTISTEATDKGNITTISTEATDTEGTDKRNITRTSNEATDKRNITRTSNEATDTSDIYK
jgi:uncharacterized membrane protein